MSFLSLGLRIHFLSLLQFLVFSMLNIYNIYRQRNPKYYEYRVLEDHQVCVPTHFIDKQNNFNKLVQAHDFGPKCKHEQRNELFFLTHMTSQE